MSLGSVSPLLTAYASFWRRLAAFVIDCLFLLIVGVVVSLLVGPRFPATPEEVEMIHRNDLNLGVLLNWAYFAGMESSLLQATWGKYLMGIAVIDLTGKRISFGRATVRCFSKYISGIVLGIGFLMVGFTKRKQALHDLIAGSLVVHTKEGRAARNAPIINRERGYYQTMVETKDGVITVMTKANKSTTSVMPSKFSELGRLAVGIEWTTSDRATLEQCHEQIIKVVREAGLAELRAWANQYIDFVSTGLPVDDMGGLIKRVI